MALPDKHQLKFNIHKDAKTLMEAIEKRFGGNKETKKVQKTLLKQQYENFIGSSSESLDQIHDKLQKLIKWRTHTLIWRNKIDLEDQSLDDLFNSLRSMRLSTNESVSTVASVSAASTKVPVSALPNVDTLSDVVIYSFFASQSNSPQLDNDDLKQIDADDLEEMDLKWQMAILESVEARLLVYQQNEIVFEEDIKLLKVDVELRDNALVALRQKFKKAEHERDELKLKLEKFQTSLKNLSQLLASQTNDKTRLGYDNQVFTSSMFDCDEMFSSESDVSMHASPVYDRKDFPKSRGHSNSKNTKACFVCKSLTYLIKDCAYYEKKMAQTSARNHAQRRNHQHYTRMTHPNPERLVVPTAVLTRSKLVPLTAARPVTTTVPHNNVTEPRPAKTIFTKPHLPPRRYINRRPSLKSSNFPHKVTTAKGDPQHALKDKGVIDSGCSRYMTGNMSYVIEFEEINGGYVAFGGNPKGGKITSKGKIRTGKLDIDDVYFVKELKFNLFIISQMYDKKNNFLFTDTECIVLSLEFKLPDENQMLLRVPRENNMYNVDLKNIVPSGDLTCLFAKATLDESNLWHRRLGHINYKTMNKLVKGNLIRGLPSKVFENNHTCVACKKGKQHRASCKTKPNRVLVTKPYNKTPYELLLGRTPSIGFMRPFGYLVTILNTLDPLGKFDRKANDGFLVGYSVSNKAFRVFNSRTRIVQETLHINFLENKPNAAGSGPTWLFDIDTLTKSMNNQLVTAGNQPNPSLDPQNTDDDTTFEVKEPEFEGKKHESDVSPSNSAKTKKHDDKTTKEAKGNSHVQLSTGFQKLNDEFEDFSDNSINEVNAAGTSVPVVGQISTNSTNTFSVDALEDITYSNNKEDVGAEADFTNLETTITVSPIPITRVHKDHHEEGIDYKEDFALVVRIEAIRLFLAYASFRGFMVYQMDVKSVFLYGTIKEEVYVCQPTGFKDLDYPNKVYKVVKALYGLHQAPRAWYEILANYLLENGF
nr:ribonuclease H-like domain-containing protein [Tanacetum cinerariifolium]